ncbi:MAG: hypothetical protein ACLFT3_02455 [Cyclobacteriaceae bacterium]
MKKKLCQSLAKYTLFGLCMLGAKGALLAQVSLPIGTWRTHFSYQSVQKLAVAGNRVYAAAQNGLFFYDQEDQSLNVLSRLDGLSDAGVAALAYDESRDLLLIAYRSGAVDALSGNRLAAFTLLRDEGAGESIFEILILDQRIFLATSEGVRVLLLEREGDLSLRILESYTRLSSTGENLPVYDMTVFDDSLFLATPEGVIANALAPSVNRQDFASWRRFGPAEGIPSQRVSHLAQKTSGVYAAVDEQAVYVYQDGSWQLTPVLTTQPFRSLNAYPAGIAALAGDSLFALENEGALQIFLPSPQPREAVFDNRSTLWIADAQEGLLRIREQEAEALAPNGPVSDALYGLYYQNDTILALAEGRAAFSIFRAGQWINYEEEDISSGLEVQTLSPLLDVAWLEAEDNYYFATAGAGLLRWDGMSAFGLVRTDDTENSLGNDMISAVESVGAAQLWISSYGSSNSLHLYDATASTWNAFGPSGAAGNFPLDITVADDGRLWLLSGQAGVGGQTGRSLQIFDAETSETALLQNLIPSGSLSGDIFTEVVNDKEGRIWIGGNEGISYIPSPASIFENPAAVKPIFENQFLLFGDYITALAVDGGNRKWVGTRNGLWLFGPDGEELVSRFTTANSPLPSDTILDISIEGSSGEVFFLTSRGLVSYRGTATTGQETHTEVKIFPNPVPPAYEGLVGMSGLVNDAIVKITTISGTLVRELRAEGGTAVWDISDYNGSRVATGVYLVFSASADGSQTFVGKLAVIN